MTPTDETPSTYYDPIVLETRARALRAAYILRMATGLRARLRDALRAGRPARA